MDQNENDYLEGLYLWEDDYLFEKSSIDRFFSDDFEIRDIQIDHIEL